MQRKKFQTILLQWSIVCAGFFLIRGQNVVLAQTTSPENDYLVEYRLRPVMRGETEDALRQEHDESESDFATRLQTSRTTVRGKIKREYTRAWNGVSLRLKTEEVSAIARSPYIKRMHPDVRVRALLSESVPLVGADVVRLLDQNGFSCADTRQLCLTGKGVSVAVIDSGIDYRHPDLGGCFGIGCKVRGGFDFVQSDADPRDDHGHGTHVAAIIASNGTLRGMAPDVDLYAYKVLDGQKGEGFVSWVLAAIELAVDPNQDGSSEDHVGVINLSLGTKGDPDDPLSVAVDNAVRAGVIVVVAAGNSGPNGDTDCQHGGDGSVDSVCSPGTARLALTVGATYKKSYAGVWWGESNPVQDRVALFSSRGPVTGLGSVLLKPEMYAPGAMICAARRDGFVPVNPNYTPCGDERHILLAGTSVAAPHVAGAAALLKQVRPDLDPARVKELLIRSSDNIAVINPDILPGTTQRLNIPRAIDASLNRQGDLNMDRRTDISDLSLLLSSWNRNDKPLEDIDQNGVVDVMDLSVLLSNWGVGV